MTTKPASGDAASDTAHDASRNDAPRTDGPRNDALDERPLALLALLAEHDGVSLPRAAKRLGLAASELRRVLTALGDDPQFGGLGVVECRLAERGHERLWLTERGRALCRGDAIDRNQDRGPDRGPDRVEEYP